MHVPPLFVLFFCVFICMYSLRLCLSARCVACQDAQREGKKDCQFCMGDGTCHRKSATLYGSRACKDGGDAIHSASQCNPEFWGGAGTVTNANKVARFMYHVIEDGNMQWYVSGGVYEYGCGVIERMP